jgi:hypothetical protein
VVLLIRRTVRPRGYASGFDSPAASLDSLFEQPAMLLEPFMTSSSSSSINPGKAGVHHDPWNFFRWKTNWPPKNTARFYSFISSTYPVAIETSSTAT